MTTTIKLAPALPKNAVDDVDASRMWHNLGGHYMAIVELQVGERTEPADEEDTAPSAKLKVTQLELARGAHDDEQLRRALLSRHTARTAVGTLDEEITSSLNDGSVPADLSDALLDYINNIGAVAGRPAKAVRSNGTLTIDVDLT